MQSGSRHDSHRCTEIMEISAQANFRAAEVKRASAAGAKIHCVIADLRHAQPRAVPLLPSCRTREPKPSSRITRGTSTRGSILTGW